MFLIRKDLFISVLSQQGCLLRCGWGVGNNHIWRCEHICTLSALWAREARGGHPVIHPVRHQGGESEYMTICTRASKNATKGARGPSVQMQWVCTCNNHIWRHGHICLKMRQHSYNNQVLGHGCGVHTVPSSDAAMCATFKDMAICTMVSKDSSHVPKKWREPFIQMQLVHVWAKIMSGCTRGATGGHLVHPAGIIGDHMSKDTKE